jgi:hypothetical protein
MAFKSIQVVSAKVTGTHTRFPVLVQPSAISGIGALTLAQMQSMRVYSDEAKTTELAREIVGSDEMWVSVTSLSNTTTIYLSYDGIASDYAVGATYGRNAVWSDYEAVFHFKEGSGTTATNSTGGTDGTLSSSALWGTDSPFGEAAGLEFDGTNYVDSGVSGDLQDYTITDWRWDVDTGAASYYRWGALKDGSNRMGSYFDGGNASHQNYLMFEERANVRILIFFTNLFEQWVHAGVVSPKNGTYKFWQNTTALGSGSVSNNDCAIGTNNIYIGALNNAGSASNKTLADNHLTEWRIRLDSVSTDWLTTENNTGRSGFWQTATDLGGGGGPVQNSSFLTIF